MITTLMYNSARCCICRYWVKSKCRDSSSQSVSADETEELKLENVAGIFIILCGGLILATAAMGLERLAHTLGWHTGAPITQVGQCGFSILCF